MRIALFGGAFDPIHNAHLMVAREAARLCRLDRILFVPAAHPPHKQTHAPYEDRYRMVELALAGQPGLEPSRLEAKTAYSYSIETIERLRPQLAEGDELFFLIGADAFAEIRTWRRWRELLGTVRFIVVGRPGHAYDAPEGARVERLDCLSLPVSSSEVRGRLSRGEACPEVPPAVLRYIRERGLYRRTHS